MTQRYLFGPGPSLVSARVMSALARPVLGHLDPMVITLLDDVHARLVRVFRAPAGSIALAVSGTGTAAMETAIANLVAPGRRVLVASTGYFGQRMAEISARYGGEVRTVDAPWGRAIDPDRVREALDDAPSDIVCVVHAETSTGVRNPVAEICALARAHGALAIVDCVTSLGGMPVDMSAWGADVCYSGSQKCLGAPSGIAPIAVAPTARARLVPCRSFYFDLALLDEYWTRRKYHHTIGSPLVQALHEALVAVEDEGLETRWARHLRIHQAFAAAAEAMHLSFLPPAEERLTTLNAVRVPDGVNDVTLREELRDQLGVEIGAGMGPLAGKIWRIGLMGASATPPMLLLLIGALEAMLARQGHQFSEGSGTAAAAAVLTN
jgi:alanine-glyoxylate transaminase / serine-glyoxylate transaminase / serine-pyruvate transaminase